MFLIPKKISYYILPNGRAPFSDWFHTIDSMAADIVHDRLERVKEGYYGDYKNLGEGVLELRVHFGPGYRIYFGIDGLEMVLLLCGGDKSSQSKDIRRAKILLKDYRNAKKK
jgi:putative addiction module killer protein